MSAAKGTLRERGGRYYIRTRVWVIDPDTGEGRWKQVERKAGTNRKRAGERLKELQTDVDEDTFVPTTVTVRPQKTRNARVVWP